MNQYMKSNDEDLNLFLEELGTLLNKYHYTFSNGVILSKFIDSKSRVVAFNGDGAYLFAVMEIVNEESKDE